jgi:serine protease AprX
MIGACSLHEKLFASIDAAGYCDLAQPRGPRVNGYAPRWGGGEMWAWLDRGVTMNTGTLAGGAKRRVVTLLGVCMLCVCTQLGRSRAFAQVEGSGDPTPVGRTGLLVTTEPGDEGAPPVYRLALTGDPRTTGPVGEFYRTTRPISHTQVIEVEPPADRAIPEGSNSFTQLVLWNERAEDGKLWPHRAIRHGGSHADDLGSGPLGNWGDENDDGIDDLGFVCIGLTDYRVMLRYAEFDPVGVSRTGGEFDAASEPYQVGESTIVEGLRASDVPGGCHVYIVQFWTQPIEEFAAALTTAGGDVLHFITNSSYLVRLPSQSEVTAVRELPAVRWVGEFHPVYRIESEALVRLLGADGPPPIPAIPARYNIQVLGPTWERRQALALEIVAAGGLIEENYADDVLVSATLTPDQLRSIVLRDEVAYLDPWQPPVTFMDNVRVIGGASFLAQPPREFRGEGVRGEVFDTGIVGKYDNGFVSATHLDFQPPPIASSPFSECFRLVEHGTRTYGIVFGSGIHSSTATGMLPAAQGIFGTVLRVFDHVCCLEFEPQPPCSSCGREPPCTPCPCPGPGRFNHIQDLRDNYQAVFQSSSYGSNGVTTSYSTVSAQLDHALFQLDFLGVQAQGNSSSIDSAHEAWAKNVVSVGGIKHDNNQSRDDDCWGCSVPSVGFSASHGPASGVDGWVKPDLAHFIEQVRTTTSTEANHEQGIYTDNFIGTSAAAPIVAGHFGIFFEMWHKKVFSGFGSYPNGTVFSDRAHAATAKAMMINTAFRYDWSASAPPKNQDITRYRQGWGMPNLHDNVGLGMYDLRDDFVIIDQTDILTHVGDSTTHLVLRVAGKPLRATLVYRDPPGGGPSSLPRINDLTLKVVAPDGTVYRGNHGLLSGNWSAPGGTFDKVNTVENVFIQSPQGGYWTVEVSVSELNEDGHPETPGFPPDADYALVISGADPPPTGGSTRTDWNNSGNVDGTDFAAFLSAFFEGKADLNSDAHTTTLDFWEFMNAYHRDQGAGGPR